MKKSVDSPFLSVVIPVYNQALELEVSLNSLARSPVIKQLIENGDIEVLISNNASDDSTPQLRLKAEHLGIHWFDQSENLGFRGNIEFLGTEATGTYLWIIGAGERVASKPFVAMLGKLRLGDFDIGTVGCSYFTPSDQQDFELLSKFSFIKSSFSLLRPPYTEAIAGMIFSRSIFNSQFRHTGASGNWWPHIELASRVAKISRPSKVFYFPQPVVSIYSSTDGWWTKPGSEEVIFWHINVLGQNNGTFLLWPANLIKYFSLFASLGRTYNAEMEKDISPEVYEKFVQIVDNVPFALQPLVQWMIRNTRLKITS
jgi:hypothetical protein